MAWTAPRTWTTSELVTAAFMNAHVRDNFLQLGGSTGSGSGQTINAFTNTSYADLDALTTSSGTAVSVSVATMTTAIVILSAGIISNTTANQLCYMAYRVSGASTIASSDTYSVRSGDDTSLDGLHTGTFVDFQDGLTAGTNTFELQARVSSNAGLIAAPQLIVIPLTT